MRYKAILFDTRSIQSYIFSGNQLKTNIGASYLVERVFDDVLLPVLRSVLGEDALDAETWMNVEEPCWDEMSTAARVGYIGGGNALILFRAETAEETLRTVVAAFTKELLVRMPGLHTGAAIGELELAADGSFVGEKNLTALVHALKDGQNTVFPLVNVPGTGLTLTCQESGETANAWDETERRFYAWEVEMKLRADRRDRREAPAEAELMKKLSSVLPAAERDHFLSGYAFPMEFADLGQRQTENDIAVVHIDGNNMGRKFQDCRTLTARKNMSRAIRSKTIAAFTELVQNIISDFDAYEDELSIGRDREQRPFLPIRPLVLGGDDMTFVCAAKVAVRYTRFIMDRLKDSGIASCGGITIMNTNYPFFRGYQMAEELCGAAKKCMRDLEAAAGQETDSCWLDYAILHGEQAPTLDQFRAEEYRGARGDLHFGSYRVDAPADAQESLDALLSCVRGMRALPCSKVKELRRVLAYGEHEQWQFMAQLAHLRKSDPGMRLPSVPAWQAYEETLWAEGRTPYVDAIELMDYTLADEEV